MMTVTTATMALDALQVIGLLLPVVMVTMRFLVPELEPNSDALRSEQKRQKRVQNAVGKASIITLVLLLAAAVFMTIGIITTYNLPAALLFGYIILLTALILFGGGLAYVVYDIQKS